MSEIQSLTARAQHLARTVDWWNTATILALIAAALAAIAVVVTTRVALNRAKELADVQARLLHLKEGQIAVDLHEKDLKIAQANQAAGEANERAGKLENEAARLTTENLRLEKAIEPRRLSTRQQEALSSLAAFSGRTVAIRSYSSDTEGLVLATQIMAGLTRSGLHIRDNRLTMQPAGSVSIGVSIEGTDNRLVEQLKRILSMDGRLTATSTIASPGRAGFAVGVSFGEIGVPPPAATVTVGVKSLN